MAVHGLGDEAVVSWMIYGISTAWNTQVKKQVEALGISSTAGINTHTSAQTLPPPAVGNLPAPVGAGPELQISFPHPCGRLAPRACSIPAYTSHRHSPVETQGVPVSVGD